MLLELSFSVFAGHQGYFKQKVKETSQMNSFWVLASLGALDLQEIYAQGNLQPKGCWEKATLFSNKPAGFHCALIQSSDFRDSGGLWVLLFGQWPFIDCAGFY